MWRPLARGGLRHRRLLDSRQPDAADSPGRRLQGPLKGNIDWTFGGSGHRHIWVHKNGALLFGTSKESDHRDSGVQTLGTGLVNVTAVDYFELVARQISDATKDVGADELTWFAIEVVE